MGRGRLGPNLLRIKSFTCISFKALAINMRVKRSQEHLLRVTV